MSASDPRDAVAGVGSAGAALEVDDVVRIRASVRVLDGLDLAVAPAEIVSIIGPSGCGATTLLRIIGGLERMDAGTVRIGHPGSAPQRTVALFSTTPLPRFGRVQDSIATTLRRAGSDDPEGEARQLCDWIGLERPDAPVHRLARGDRRKVALARALAVRPTLLLLDDPLAGLHTAERAELQERLVRRLRDDRITTVWVTRETSEAVAVADHVAVMLAGRIVASARPEDLYRRAGDPEVAAVLGPVSAVPGIVEDRTVDVWGQAVPLADAAHDGHCEVVVRPDQVLLVGPDGPGVTAVVQQSTFLGSMRRTLVRADDGSLVQVEHSAAEPLALAERVRIALAPVPVTTRPLG